MNWPHLLAQAEAEIVGDDPLLHPERIPLIDPRRRELSAPAGRLWRAVDAAMAILAVAAALGVITYGLMVPS